MRRGNARSEERRVGKEWRYWRDWSSDVCSSDLATVGDQSQRTAKAIAWIRTNYTKPLLVEDLAQIAGMGVSTLHHRFRALTAMSPLQYQKKLRLHAARERKIGRASCRERVEILA